MAGPKQKGGKGPSSSSRAAAFLSSNAASTGFGFGAASGLAVGFGTAAATPSDADGPPVDGLDPEISQCLKRLSKRDANTRFKAAKALLPLVQRLDDAEAIALLPSWLFTYKRLVMDNHRAVRLGAAHVLAALLTTAGRKLAPLLKDIVGPWWLAMQDAYDDVSKAARSSFETIFASPQKQQQAVIFVHSHLVAYLHAKAVASAADLGDASKDSPEELEDRQQRVTAQALHGLQSLVTLVAPSADDTAPGHEGSSGGVDLSDVQRSFMVAFDDVAFWKRAFGDSLDARAQDAACVLVTVTATRWPELLEPQVTALAPLVFGALRPGAAAPWDTALAFAAAFPASLQQSDVAKQLPQSLETAGASGALGGAEAQAVLPLLIQMLRSGPEAWRGPQFAVRIGSKFAAGVTASAGKGTEAQVVDAFAEVLVVFVRHAASRDDEAASKQIAGAMLGRFLPSRDGRPTSAQLPTVLSRVLQAAAKLTKPEEGGLSQHGTAILSVIADTLSATIASQQPLPESAAHDIAAVTGALVLAAAPQSAPLQALIVEQVIGPVRAALVIRVSASEDPGASVALAALLQQLRGAPESLQRALRDEGPSNGNEASLRSGLPHVGTLFDRLVSRASFMLSNGSDSGLTASEGAVGLLCSVAGDDDAQWAVVLQHALAHSLSAEVDANEALSAIEDMKTDASVHAHSLAALTGFWQQHQHALNLSRLDAVAQLLLMLDDGSASAALRSADAASDGAIAPGRARHAIVTLCLAAVMLAGSQPAADLLHRLMASLGAEQDTESSAAVRTAVLRALEAAASAEELAREVSSSDAESAGGDSAQTLLQFITTASRLLPCAEIFVRRDLEKGRSDSTAVALLRLALPAEKNPHMPAQLPESGHPLLAAFVQISGDASNLWRALCASLDHDIHATAVADLARLLVADARKTRESDVAAGARAAISGAHAAAALLDAVAVSDTNSAAARLTWHELGRGCFASGELMMPPDLNEDRDDEVETHLRRCLRAASGVGTLWPASDALKHLLFLSAVLVRVSEPGLRHLPAAFASAIVVCLLACGAEHTAVALIHTVAPALGAARTQRVWARVFAAWWAAVLEDADKAHAPGRRRGADPRAHICRDGEVLARLLLHPLPGIAFSRAATEWFERILSAWTPEQVTDDDAPSMPGALLDIVHAASRHARHSSLHPEAGAAAADSAEACDAFAARWLAHACTLPPVLSASAESAAPAAFALRIACAVLHPISTRTRIKAPAKAHDGIVCAAVLGDDETLRPPRSLDGNNYFDNLHAVDRRRESHAQASTSAPEPHPDASRSLSFDFADALNAAVRHQLRPANAPALMSDQPPHAIDHPESALLQLLQVASRYMASDLSDSDTARVLALLEVDLNRHTSEREDATEAICAAAVAAAQSVPGAPAQMDPGFALTFASRLTASAEAVYDPDAVAALQLATQSVKQCFYAATPSALAFLHLSTCPAHAESRRPDPPAALLSVIRMLFCFGAALHASSMVLGQQAAEARLARSRSLLKELHCLAAVVLRLNDAGAMADAVQEYDEWSSHLGVTAFDALLALLACSAVPTALRSAATVMLLQPALLAQVSIPMDGELDELQEGERRSGDAAEYLTLVGVAPRLAAVLVRPLTDDYDTETTSPSTQSVLLAWVLLIAHMTDSSTPTEARQRLSIAVGALDEVLKHIFELVACMLPYEHTDDPDVAAERQQAAQRAEGRAWDFKVDAIAALRRSASIPVGSHTAPSRVSAEDEGWTTNLAAALYCSSLQAFPASLRSWHSSLRSAELASAIELYTATLESPRLLALEAAAASAVHNDGMEIKASGVAREVIASIEVDEGVSLDLNIRMPPSFPLKPAEVSLKRKVAFSEKTVRRWLLTIASFLRYQNCSVADAVLMWKRNVDQEFAGVEECMICVSVIHPSNRSLPKMKCKTCAQVFHNICLFKWFKSSGKSNCPHCQTPWL